jgi:transposase InsO family protein
MCKVLDVSEQGYYKHLKALNKPGKDDILSAAIDEVMEVSIYNDNYGTDRMRIALEQMGLKFGKRRVTKIMRAKGLIHKPRRRPKGLTKVTTEIEEKENLIKQDFTAEAPLKKLLTDITQVQCVDGKLYISPVLDCYNGEILALEMRDNMKKKLCIDTVMDVVRNNNLRGAVLHSDRGSQYTSEEFRKTLYNLGIIQSLSGVDHCYDNARMESFFATLKKELIYRIPAYKMNMEEVKTLVFRYVYIYYNQQRIYTTNPGGYPPTVYRLLSKRKEVAA